MRPKCSPALTARRRLTADAADYGPRRFKCGQSVRRLATQMRPKRSPARRLPAAVRGGPYRDGDHREARRRPEPPADLAGPGRGVRLRRAATSRSSGSCARSTPTRRAVGVYHCAPGEEGQVDFFRGAPTLDAATGEWRRPWVFRMTLGHSRHGYEEAVWDQKLETFLRLHEHAFRDLGGVPRVVRHDNLKAAVVRACFYDPDSHDVYLAFAAHWGFTPLPTQPRTPQENGKQERSGGYVKRQRAQGPPLRQPRGAECVSAALESHDRAAPHPRHDAAPGVDALRRDRAARAAAARRRAVSLLRERRAHGARGRPRRSGRAPSIRCRSRCSGSGVRVRWDAHLVRVFHGDTLVAVHARVAPGALRAARRRGRGLDAPASLRRSAARPVRARRARAAQWADAALAARGVRAIRLIQGVLGLTRRASARARARRRHEAHAHQHFRYQTIRQLVERTPAPPSARARHRGSRDSSDDPIHLGGLSR